MSGESFCAMIKFLSSSPVDTRRRFNVYVTYIQRRRRRIDVLYTLKRRRVSTGKYPLTISHPQSFFLLPIFITVNNRV